MDSLPSNPVVYLRGQFSLDAKCKRNYSVIVDRNALRYSFVGSSSRRTSTSSSSSAEITSISVDDIVGCESQKGRSDKDSGAYLVIYAYSRAKVSNGASKPGNSVRKRKTLMLRFADHKEYARNLQEANAWKCVLSSLARKIQVDPNIDLVHLQMPPALKLLVLVNPFSGPGHALHIFQRQIVPVFVEAGLQYHLVVTEYAGHAKEFVKSIDLHMWNGIVIVSGDGLLFEVVNGLMERDDWKQAIKIPLAALPGGSGNALSCAVCHDAGESYLKKHELSAAFIVAKHDIVAMDLVAIDLSSGKRIYSFLSVGWGMMADVDIESEKYRSIGNARFALMAVIKIAGMKTYRGKLSYLPASARPTDSATRGDNDNNTLGGPVQTPLLAPLGSSLPDGWVTVEDDFILVGAVYQSHLAKDNRMALNSRLDDGIIHLIYCRGNSRLGMMQMLASLENGLRITDSSCATLVEVLAFRIEPSPDSPPGIMTVDGESVEYGPIQGQILPSMARVMSIRPPNDPCTQL